MVAELTKKEFDLIARLIRSKEPTRTGAFKVLVQGKANKDVIAELGITGPSLSNTLGRFRRTHKEILAVYKK